MKSENNNTEVWVLKRINENSSLIGTRKIKKINNVGGVEEEEEIGEYNGDGLPGMYDDIIPKYNVEEKKWAWGGTEKRLQELVKELGLYDSKDKLIEKANLNNYTDAFFTHKIFRETPPKMEKVFTFDNTLVHEVLRTSWAGWDRVLMYGEEEKISSAELKTKQYLLILSTNLDNLEKETIDKRIEAYSKLYKMTLDVKNLIAVICQEVYQIGNKDSIVTNKLAKVAENTSTLTHMQNKRLYSNETGQEVLIKYADENLVTLTMAATIVMAINRNNLRYSTDGYKNNGKLVGTGYAKLDELITYYKENEKDFDELTLNVRLK